jgi:carbamoyl-phosphate synthase large subunit
MKKNVLITSFDTAHSFEFYKDLKNNNSFKLYLADCSNNPKFNTFTSESIRLLPGSHENYCEDLLDKALKNDILMIIPNSDEEAISLMKKKHLFTNNGIDVAVQDKNYLNIFQSKSSLYDELSKKDFPVPFYKVFKTANEFNEILNNSNYPEVPYLIKLNQGRGGRGIFLLSEFKITNKDNLQLLSKNDFECMIDDFTEYMIMDYINGEIYDVDILVYHDGEPFISPRKRFSNVTKNFSGNQFIKNEELVKYCEKILSIIPTKYLIDYDVIVSDQGELTLLEINPRPSGSLISYLPFGTNLYTQIFDSYINQVKTPINTSFIGESTVLFHQMLIRKK